MQETERTMALLDGDAFSAQREGTAEEFRARVELYESAVEPLAIMAGVLGRWGGNTGLGLALDVLRTLHRNPKARLGGNVFWTDLHSYPAVLVFTAYAIGLTKSNEWSTLRALFLASIPVDHGNHQRVVNTFFLWSWKASTDHVWGALAGMKHSITPYSDHVLAVMSQWRRSFIGVDASFELLYEHYEVMGSLVKFEENDEEELERLRAQGQELSIWMPIGRAGWNRATGPALLDALKDEQTATELIALGYAKGSRRMLELFVENFWGMARRIRW